MSKLSKLIKIIAGLLFVVAGIYLIVVWWKDVLNLIQGGLPFLLGMIGAVFLLLGWED